MSIAACASRTVAAIAREYNVSRTHIRHTIQGVALCYLMTWRVFLAQLTHVYSTEPVEVFLRRVKADDAKQRVAFQLHKWLTRDQRIAAWNLLVAERMAVIVSRGERRVLCSYKQYIKCPCVHV